MEIHPVLFIFIIVCVAGGYFAAGRLYERHLWRNKLIREGKLPHPAPKESK